MKCVVFHKIGSRVVLAQFNNTGYNLRSLEAIDSNS